MRNLICGAMILVSTTSAHAELKTGMALVHNGICEASAAVALPEGKQGKSFIVANDEDNILRVYSAEKSGGPLVPTNGDLNGHLGLDSSDDDEKADFEGATSLNGKMYWIGSHSRSKKGNLRESRWQFFSTTISMNEQTAELSASASSHDLLGAIASLDNVLTNAIQVGVSKSPNLAAEKKGINIEGLTVRADGKSMFIGLRNPLSEKNKNKAFLIPFENPEAVAGTGAKPVLGKLVEIDLAGKGIRSIEYSAAANSYFIVAGPSNDTGSFELYRWSGKEQEQPVAVQGSAAAFATIPDFHPEAIFSDSSGRNLHILSDDGDRKIDGTPCKDLGESQRSFRSFVFTVD